MTAAPSIKIHTLNIHMGAPALPLGETLIGTLESLSRATDERFTLSADGVLATDHKTGLMWPVYESELSMDFDGLQKYIADFRLGGFGDWFNPSDEQRCSIVDRSRHSHALADPLKSRSNGWEWTSTPYLPLGNDDAGSPRAFWQVYAYDGHVNRDNRYHQAFARPCRFVARAGQ